MGKRNCLLYFFLILLVMMLSGCRQQKNTVLSLSEEQIMAHIDILTSPEFQGRMVGTLGNQKTVDYIEDYFQAIRLTPLTDGTYKRDYPAATFQWKGEPILQVIDQQGSLIAVYEEGKDFIVRLDHNSYGGHFEGGLLQVKNGREVLTTSDMFSQQAVLIDFADPAINQIQYSEEQIGSRLEAEKAGAIIYREDDVQRYRIDLGSKNKKILDKGIIKLGVKDAVFGQLKAFQEAGYGVTIEVPVEFYDARAESIYGIIPGKNPLYEEYIIIATSIDGLGLNSRGEHYPGASDNAAATALMLELARAMKEGELRLDATTVFAAFNGKHTGNVGVEYYFSQGLFPPEKTRVIFLDQIVPQTEEALLIGTFLNPVIKRTNAGVMLWELERSLEVMGIPYESNTSLQTGQYMAFRNQGVLAANITYGEHWPIGTLADTSNKINPVQIRSIGNLLFYHLQEIGFIQPFTEIKYMIVDIAGILIFGITLGLYKYWLIKKSKPSKNFLKNWLQDTPVLFGYSVFTIMIAILAWQSRYSLSLSVVSQGAIKPTLKDFILAFLNNIFSSLQMLTISLFFLIIALFVLLLILQVKFSEILKQRTFIIIALTGTIILYLALLGNLCTYDFTILWPQLISIKGSHYLITVVFGIISLLLTGVYRYERKNENSLKLALLCITLFLVFITFTYSPYILAKDIFDLRVTGGNLWL